MRKEGTSATLSDLKDEQGGAIQRPYTSCENQNALVTAGVYRPFHISVEKEEERI